MTSRPWIAMCAALIGSALIVFSAVAAPITERQKRDCRTDYQRYCSEYGLETEGLRACMSRSFKKLTNSCVAALVAAGEVSQKQAQSIRKKGSSASKSKRTMHKHTSSRKHH